MHLGWLRTPTGRPDAQRLDVWLVVICLVPLFGVVVNLALSSRPLNSERTFRNETRHDFGKNGGDRFAPSSRPAPTLFGDAGILGTAANGRLRSGLSSTADRQLTTRAPIVS
jgi:hypothetical protein